VPIRKRDTHLVDGVRLNNPANTRGGSFDFSTLAVNEIERVDIAMGAMSAIYGSDAMAGVIRIESAWPEGARLLTMLTTRIVPLTPRRRR